MFSTIGGVDKVKELAGYIIIKYTVNLKKHVEEMDELIVQHGAKEVIKVDCEKII